MMFDWTINLGHILTVLSFIMVGTGFVLTLKEQMNNLTTRLSVLEEDVKSLIGILIQQGKQEERMLAIDARLSNQGLRLDDLTKRFNDKLDK